MEAAIIDSNSKDARINLRATIYEKTLIEQAAKLQGIKVSQFILKDVLENAKSIVEKENMMVLNRIDRKAFVNAFLEEHKPSAYLSNAIKDYEQDRPSI